MPRKSGQQFSRKLEDMQNSYEAPVMEIIELEDQDVIVTSPGVTPPGFIDGPGDSGTGDF